MSKSVLVLGTGNRKKGSELVELLRPVGLDILMLSDFEKSLDVVEDGNSFAENAAKKASEQAKFLGHWVLAEDSGISVDHLKGEPGIFSARFSGPNASDESNNRLLLEKLEGVPLEKRTAHYTCHIAVSDPAGNIRANTQAYCRGRILFEPRGENGFGYDPLFELIEYHLPFGILAPVLKKWISHRSRAVRLIVPKLIELHDSGLITTTERDA